jgi:hypothetical protein
VPDSLATADDDCVGEVELELLLTPPPQALRIMENANATATARHVL